MIARTLSDASQASLRHPRRHVDVTLTTCHAHSLSLLVALIRKLVVLVVLLALVILAHQLRHIESRPCRLCAPFLVAEGRTLLA